MFQSSKESIRSLASNIRQIGQKPSNEIFSQAMSPAVVGSMMRTSEFLLANPLAMDYVAGLIWVGSGYYLVGELVEMFKYNKSVTPTTPPSAGDKPIGEGYGMTRPGSLSLPQPYSGPSFPERNTLRSLALRFSY